MARSSKNFVDPIHNGNDIVYTRGYTPRDYNNCSDRLGTVAEIQGILEDIN